MIRKALRKVLPQGWFEKPVRLDHGRMYMCVMVGLFLTSASMLIVGPVPNSTISNLNYFTQQSMALVMWLGSGMCIYGFLCGTRCFRPKADIRDSYLMAKWSMAAIGVSLGTYVVAIFINYGDLILSTIGGSIAASILVGGFWNAWDFANEVDRLDDELGNVTGS